MVDVGHFDIVDQVEVFARPAPTHQQVIAPALVHHRHPGQRSHSTHHIFETAGKAADFLPGEADVADRLVAGVGEVAGGYRHRFPFYRRDQQPGVDDRRASGIDDDVGQHQILVADIGKTQAIRARD